MSSRILTEGYLKCNKYIQLRCEHKFNNINDTVYTKFQKIEILTVPSLFTLEAVACTKLHGFRMKSMVHEYRTRKKQVFKNTQNIAVGAKPTFY